MRNALRSLFSLAVCVSLSNAIQAAKAQVIDDQTQSEATANPVPLDDEKITPMFVDGITPEQAQENALKLQEARLLDPDAELPIPLPTPTLTTPDYHDEVDANGVPRKYVIAADGTKISFPPTSAIAFALYGPKLKQTVDEQLLVLNSTRFRNIVLAAAVSPVALTTLMQFSRPILEALLFPTTTSPYSVVLPQLE